MAYNKDSGESKLRKDITMDTYVHKKGKSIFKNSQTAQTQPQPSTNPKWNYAPYSEDFRQNKRPEKKQDAKPEFLSFLEFIGIIIANIFVPIIGGFICYIIFYLRGKKRKALQSIVLSVIVLVIYTVFTLN
jgi:hypothetical protein